jgi:beta-galactosidase
MRFLLNGIVSAALVCGVSAARALSFENVGGEISLDGKWDIGIDRHYHGQTTVPGLPEDPAQMSPGTLWYRCAVQLPPGNWTLATLHLGGARFAPTIYVNGQKVARSEGGMAPIDIPLTDDNVAPGKTIELEVALQSLRDLDPQDASAVSVADRWRSDVSSSLWDDVRLHFSGHERIVRVIPWPDVSADSVAVHWSVAGEENAAAPKTIQVFVLDQSGVILAQSEPVDSNESQGVTTLNLNRTCKPWSPDSPNLYKLKVVLSEQGQTEDNCIVSFGLRDFSTEGLHFVLNNEPVQLRGGSVVWHRWLRDPQAGTIAFDPDWFETNIVLRLKSYGANFLRFHLGLPPESFLDLCDRDGLMVQMEWPFFHAVKASPESMEKQWRDWLEVGARHPCVVIIQPWNETEGDQLTKAWAALNSVLPDYPPQVIDHRDVIPIHKYWWSLFENLGLYYDSATQFDKPIMVDEFGGNYLDYNGDDGEDAVVRESLLRFLGRDQTRDERLEFQAEACGKVAEYWRRIGAAGFAPFCILSSPQDGNTWFLGSLQEAKPKPVWNAMSAAYAPASVSLEVWDRNYLPGQAVTLPLYFFNDTDQSENLNATVRIVSGSGEIRSSQNVSQIVPAHGMAKTDVPVTMPDEAGAWRFEAQLTSPTFTAEPVVSTWDCRTLSVTVPEPLKKVCLGVPPADQELKEFFARNGIRTVALDDPQADTLVLSAPSTSRLPQSPALLKTLQDAVNAGKSVVLLDIGPRDLGPGYKNDLGPLEGAPKIIDPYVEHDDLFSGIQLTFTEAAEPESHIQPAPDDDSLWASLPRQSTWLWNGLRAGLVVPSADMDVKGLSSSAFLSLWVSRGADEQSIRNEKYYYAYELAGYYAFSSESTNAEIIAALRGKVKLLAEDAPALQDRIDPKAPVECTDIAQIFQQSGAGCQATQLIPLVDCGKDLTRVPVVELVFGPSKGNVILSQVLTAGRLVPGHQEPGLYGIRYDPAAEQFTLNMVAKALDKNAAGVLASKTP